MAWPLHESLHMFSPLHQKQSIGMSALGQKQTFAPKNVMSALPPKADRIEFTKFLETFSIGTRFGPRLIKNPSDRTSRAARPVCARHVRYTSKSGHVQRN